MAESITFDVLARDRASATFTKIARSTETLESRFTRLTRAATGIATTLVGAQVGKSVLEAADQFELSRSRLETITKNIGGNFNALSKQVDSADKRMAAFGFTSAETEGALASLESVTRDPTKAIRDLALAADIARGRNIGLSEATLILQRVETGHIAQLAKLGIATKDAAGNTLTQAQALRMLTDLYGGAAANYAGTFAGKQAAVAAELKNSAAQIGVALLPAAVDLANALQHDVLPPLVDTVQWLDRNRKTIEPLVKAVLIGAAAWKTYTLAVGAANVITRTLGLTSTATAAKVVAANAAEAASAKVAAAAFASEGAVIGAAMAGGLGRGAAIGSTLLRGAPRAAGLGALIGGQYLGGRYGNELSGVGLLSMISGRAGLVGAAGIGAYEGTSALLHNTPVGGAVASASDFIANLFGGHHDHAAAAQSRNLLNDQGKDLVKTYGSIDKALAALRAQNQATAASENTLTASMQRNADQIVSHAQKTLNFTQAQDSLRQAMHAAAQTAVDNGRALTGNSDAALANRQALDAQVTGILNVIDVMKQNRSSASHQQAMLDVLTQAVEQNAIKIYGDKAAVDALLVSLGLIPGAVNNAAAALASLPTVAQNQIDSGDASPGAIHQLNQAVTKANADGKKVAKSFSDGYTPVVSKAATDAAKNASNALKQQVQTDVSAIKNMVDSVRDQVAGFADFSASGTDALGASGTNTDVAGQLKAKAEKLRQFAVVFNQLARERLDPHLLAQFVSIGPDALPAMQVLAHSASLRRSANRSEQAIQTAAGSVATTNATVQNSALIHKDLQTLPARFSRQFVKDLGKLHVGVSLSATDRKNGIAVVISP